MQNIKSLTTLRFFLAFAVLLSHTKLFFPAYGSQVLTNVGRISVTGFFILSGIIMTHVYYDTDFSNLKNKNKYYLKRFIRIYPLYILPILFFLPLKLVENKILPIVKELLNNFQIQYINDTNWLHFFIQLLNLQSITAGFLPMQFGWNNPGWSISTEFCFYFLFPFIVVVIKKFSKLITIGIFLALSIILLCSNFILSMCQHIPRVGVIPFIYMNPAVRISDFILGIVIYHLVRKHGKFIILPRLLFFITALELLLYYLAKFEIFYFLIPIFFIILLSYLLTYNPKLLCHNILVALGNASYALYLTHFVILSYLSIVVKLGYIYIDYFSLTLICVAIIIFSLIIYYYYEMPIALFLKKKFKLI